MARPTPDARQRQIDTLKIFNDKYVFKTTSMNL